MLNDKEKNSVFRGIWNGSTTLFKLPFILYNDIAQSFRGGIIKGFGRPKIEGPDLDTLNALNDNVHIFSAAKTFQEVKDMQKFIVDEEGFKRSFNKFRDDVNETYEQYNVNWQRTEFDTAFTQAQSAAQWSKIEEEKEDFPLLQYQTAGDLEVRDEHKGWDNIVRPQDDPFWDDHMPPNGFNCRCEVIQLTAGEKPITTDQKLSEAPEHDSPLFKMNPGKDELAFQETGKDMHPYFKVDKRYSVLKKNHFNLPKPEPIPPKKG